MLTNERLKEIKHNLAKWSLVYRHINTDHAIAAIDELLAIRKAGDVTDGILSAAAFDYLRQQLRDAQEEIERLRMAIGCATTIKGDMVMRADNPLGMMQEVCSHVASLKAAPGTEGVDALESEIERGILESDGAIEPLGKLAALARRYIAAHAEVVGLMRWMKDFEITGTFMKMSLGQMMEYWKQGHGATEEFLSKRDRIIEIVEGK